MAKATKAPKQSKAVGLGDTIPDFELEATGIEKFRISDLKGKNLVLYFYPKDSTPGCTLEGHDFSKLKTSFSKLNTVVYGISRDSMKSHEKFKTKQCYTVDLVSDPDETACQIFGVIKDKNMYGKKVRGIERSTFFIDSEGVLAGEWRGVKVAGHADEVLGFVKNHAKGK